MKLLVVFYLFIALVKACDIVNCTLTHIDTNHDDLISAGEINKWFLYTECGSNYYSGVTGEDLVEACDLNGNGFLDQADVSETEGCLSPPAWSNLMCEICARCDET